MEVEDNSMNRVEFYVKEIGKSLAGLHLHRENLSLWDEKCLYLYLFPMLLSV